jgi:uncharacterized protein YidB (DUF937 family)
MAGLGNILGGFLGRSKVAGSGGGLESVLGGVLGGSGGNTILITTLLPVVTNMLKGGGLNKVLSGFQAKGLSGEADSWIGKGENQSVSGDQLASVLGSARVGKIAKKVGASPNDTAGALAQLLPQVINHVTPNGQIPAKGDLKSMLKQLAQAAA